MSVFNDSQKIRENDEEVNNKSFFSQSSSTGQQTKELFDEKKSSLNREETAPKIELLVKDLLKRLSSETLKEIANELGIKSPILSKKLRELGYTYNRSKRNYVWNDQGEEPLTQDLLSMIRKR